MTWQGVSGVVHTPAQHSTGLHMLHFNAEQCATCMLGEADLVPDIQDRASLQRNLLAGNGRNCSLIKIVH